VKLAEAYVEIFGETRRLDRTIAGLSQSVVSQFGALGSRAGRALQRGLLVGGAGVGFGLSKSVKGASDLAETMAKTGEVFRGDAKVVEDAAGAMAKSFGIPKREFLDAASQFGLIAQGMGMARGESATFSANMAKLAADAASFYNVPVESALEKIRAGLIGEAEPLRAFGVMLTEDAVKAKAYAMGLAKSGAELTNHAKLAARTALIQGGLATATGDLERTQSGTANQMRKFSGALENLGDAIGAKLLPAFTDLLVGANDSIGGMADSFARGEGSLYQFVEAVKGGIETTGFVFQNFGDIASLVGVNAAEAWLNMGERIVWLGDAARAFLDWFSANWRTIIPDAMDAVLVAAQNFGANFTTLIKEVYDYLRSGFKDPIEITFKPLLEGLDAKTPQLALPELKLTSLDAERQPFLDSIAGREDEKIAKAKAAAALAVPAKHGEIPQQPGGKGKAEKVGFTDLAGNYRRLQEGLFGKGGADERTAKNTDKMVQKLDQLVKKPPTAMGPALAGA
jgi:hypothetical protein